MARQIAPAKSETKWQEVSQTKVNIKQTMEKPGAADRTGAIAIGVRGGSSNSEPPRPKPPAINNTKEVSGGTPISGFIR